MRRSEALALVQQRMPDGVWYGKGTSIRGVPRAKTGLICCGHLIITYPTENPNPGRDRGLHPSRRRPVEPRVCWSVESADWRVTATGGSFEEAFAACLVLVVEQNRRSLDAWMALAGRPAAQEGAC